MHAYFFPIQGYCSNVEAWRNLQSLFMVICYIQCFYVKLLLVMNMGVSLKKKKIYIYIFFKVLHIHKDILRKSLRYGENLLTLEDKVVFLIWPHVVLIQSCQPTFYCFVSYTQHWHWITPTLTEVSFRGGSRAAAQMFEQVNPRFHPYALHSLLSKLIESWAVWRKSP